MRRTRRPIAGRSRAALRGALLLAGVPLLWGAACAKRGPPPAPPPVPVTIAIAALEEVPLELGGIGVVEASTSVSVQARVTAPVAEVRFAEGEDVAEGEILFTLDARPFAIALAQAQATLARDRALAANAAREAERWTALAAEGIASRQDAEQRRANAIGAAATVRADEANVASSKLELSYATVRAPITGRAGSVQTREGTVVRADETVLVVINQLHPTFVSFPLPEDTLPEIQRYMATAALPVSAAIPGEREPEEGTVTFIDNAVDRATGTIRLKGTFGNEQSRLWPGQFVRVSMKLATRPAVVVPSAAVQTGQSGPYVFVVSPDLVAAMREVQLGRTSLPETVVIERGVAPGEQVVTDGQLRLVPGAKVAIVSARDAGGGDAQ